MNHATHIMAIGIITLSLNACETAHKRIDRHRELFDTLPPSHQTLIHSGKIQVGFTTDEVYFAWGHPNRKSISKDRQGQSEVWIYTVTRTATYFHPVHNYHHQPGRWHYIYGPHYVPFGYVSKDVVFENGLVDTWTVYSRLPPLGAY